MQLVVKLHECVAHGNLPPAIQWCIARSATVEGTVQRGLRFGILIDLGCQLNDALQHVPRLSTVQVAVKCAKQPSTCVSGHSLPHKLAQLSVACTSHACSARTDSCEAFNVGNSLMQKETTRGTALLPVACHVS
jgi:hypothetical protein